jgi:hypothetical protein
MSDDGFPFPMPPEGASGARKGWRCPGDETLAAWADGTLPESLRAKLEGHAADCAYCRGQLGFLARASRLGPLPAVPAHLLAAARGERTPLFVRLRPATVVAAGAGLLLALLVASPWGRPGFPWEPGSAGDGIESSAGAGPARDVRSLPGGGAAPRVLHPAEGASLPRADLALRWQESPGALFYTVQVVDADGDVAWEGRAEGASLAVPDAAPLVPGTRYFAWVFAHLPSGATVASPAVGFRLAPG